MTRKRNSRANRLANKASKARGKRALLRAALRDDNDIHHDEGAVVDEDNPSDEEDGLPRKTRKMWQQEADTATTMEDWKKAMQKKAGTPKKGWYQDAYTPEEELEAWARIRGYGPFHREWKGNEHLSMDERKEIVAARRRLRLVELR